MLDSPPGFSVFDCVVFSFSAQLVSAVAIQSGMLEEILEHTRCAAVVVHHNFGR